MENKKLEIEEKPQEFQEEVPKNGVKLPELLQSVGTANTEIKRGRAGARIMKVWEQLVKTSAGEVRGKEPIVYNRAIKW